MFIPVKPVLTKVVYQTRLHWPFMIRVFRNHDKKYRPMIEKGHWVLNAILFHLLRVEFFGFEYRSLFKSF